MSDRSIFITEHDIKLLRRLLFDYGINRQYLKNLTEELDRACIVRSQDVPKDVVTMNSRTCIVDLDTNEEMNYTLVFPQDADVQVGKISVLAPIGTAILGYRVGNEFEWEVPDGVRKLRVKEVLYQP